jgi:DNA-directed RNA polymerase subunit alpha
MFASKNKIIKKSKTLLQNAWTLCPASLNYAPGWSPKLFPLFLFVALQGGIPMTRIPISQAEEKARQLQENLDLSTAEIGLQVRTTNCLEEKGIFTVRQLLQASPETLLSIANFGDKTLEEVYLALEKYGYYRPWRKPR